MAADVGDPLHMAWAMAWVGHQLPRDPLDLFQSNNFYPYANSLAFGDHLLPEGLLGLPINLITSNAVLALNLVTGFGLISSSFAIYLLISKLLGSHRAGLIAGTVLIFNSFIQGEILRVNVLQLQGWCFALLFLWRYVESPAWRSSIAFSLALLFQGLTGTYYAIYSAVVAPGFVVAAYAASRRLPGRMESLRLALPAFVAFVFGFLFLSPYRVVAKSSLAQKPIADGADLAAFFLPGKDFWLWSGIMPSAPFGESNHFLGYLPILLAGLAIRTLFVERASLCASKRFIALCAAVLIMTGGAIALGAYPRFMGAALGESPYLFLVRSFPTLRGMATVERAGVLVEFGLALMAGLGAEKLFRSRHGFALAFALSAVCAAEQWTKPGPGFRVPAGSELPEVYRSLANGQGPVVELPVFPDRLLRFRALYPYFSTYHWRPVPIGRASFYPPAHDYFATLLQSFPDELSIGALREAGIRDLVVHPQMWETRRAARLRALEGPDFQLQKSFPGAVSEAARSLGLGDDRLYRLMPGPKEARVCRPEREIDLRQIEIKSTASEGIERMRDGNLGTAWSTVVPQKEGDALELHWKEDQSFAAIRLALGDRPSEFPIALRVDTAQASGGWTESVPLQLTESAMETLHHLLASDPGASITIRIPAVTARSVRLRVGHDESRPPWNPWSVAEIHLFSECSEPKEP